MLRTQTPKRGRLAGGVVSGDSDILLLLWALRSGVPATASCKQSLMRVSVPYSELLREVTVWANSLLPT